eukprot:3735999-Rhodomonas_salina.2
MLFAWSGQRRYGAMRDGASSSMPGPQGTWCDANWPEEAYRRDVPDNDGAVGAAARHILARAVHATGLDMHGLPLLLLLLLLLLLCGSTTCLCCCGDFALLGRGCAWVLGALVDREPA